ncbi:ABC transporter substrate-binding protein [Rothia sp. ZJ1223]|uniref:ABC transporter substrate-binding protein n=1 Tax=Rothia sp. ZJ1223 TaxID=2811098 RepID=UPI00195A88C1|nr:ABC transporter substrate-binding protein [Rothia sp. ZJ1223]MBM7050961.1 hypothetical protein [Rothia sp. ZJ1223]
MDSSALSRRDFTRLSALIALGVPLSACTSDAISPADSAPAVPEKVLRFANAAPVISLDPGISTSFETGRVCAQILEGLTLPNLDTGLPEPGLAKSWEVSDDGLVYTFEVRTDVMFHDGEALNAEVVVQNFDRFKQLASVPQSSAVSRYLSFFGTATPAGELEPLIASYQGQGNQLVVRLSRPSVSFLAALSQPAFGLRSPSALDQQPSAEHLIVGTGPFRCTSWNKGAVTLEKFENYWGTTPSIDRVEFSAITSSQMRYYRLTKGEIDGYDQVGLNDFVPLARAGYQTRIRDPYALAYVGFNLQNPLMQDSLIRQAMTHAIDANAIVSGIFPQGSTRARDFIPPLFMMDSDEINQLISYDPERSKKLLQESAYKGEPLEFYYPTDVSLPSMERPEVVYASVAGHLSRAGFNIKPRPIKWSDGYLEAVRSAPAEQALYLDGFIGAYRDPAAFLGRVLAPLRGISGDIDTAISSSDISAATGDSAAVTPVQNLSDTFKELYAADAIEDLTEHREKYAQASYHLMQHFVAIPLAFAVSSVALANTVTTYPMSATGLDNLAYAGVSPRTS